MSNTLGEMRPGQSAVIVSLEGKGAIRRRLVDMGLTPGVRVFVRKVAPLGDPLEIHLRGFEMSLRRQDARKIRVEDVREARDAH